MTAPPHDPSTAGRTTSASTPLRLLLGLHLVSMIGRGVFYALSAVYFTQVVGLSLHGFGVALTLASGMGVACSYAAGLVADRLPAAHVMTATLLVEAAALLALPRVSTLLTFGILAGIEVGMNRGFAIARQALLARLFVGPERTAARARMRVVTNLGMGLGSGLAAIVLLIGTPAVFRHGFSAAAIAYLAAAVLALRLPATTVRAGRSSEPGTDTSHARPWRDRRYLLLTCLNGAVVTHFAILEIGVPVWLVTRTEAPGALVGALLFLNTTLVVLLQVRLNRGFERVERAGRGLLTGGLLLSAGAAAYAVAAWGGPLSASLVLITGGVLHAMGEILTSGGGFSLSFELADPRAAGAYQGAYGTGQALGMMLGPLLVTTVIDVGIVGWLLYAVAYALLGLAGWSLTRTVVPGTGPTGEGPHL